MTDQTVCWRLTADGQQQVSVNEALRAISHNYHRPQMALLDSDEQHPVTSGLAYYWLAEESAQEDTR